MSFLEFLGCAFIALLIFALFCAIGEVLKVMYRAFKVIAAQYKPVDAKADQTKEGN